MCERDSFSRGRKISTDFGNGSNWIIPDVGDNTFEVRCQNQSVSLIRFPPTTRAQGLRPQQARWELATQSKHPRFQDSVNKKVTQAGGPFSQIEILPNMQTKVGTSVGTVLSLAIHRHRAADDHHRKVMLSLVLQPLLGRDARGRISRYLQCFCAEWQFRREEGLLPIRRKLLVLEWLLCTLFAFFWRFLGKVERFKNNILAINWRFYKNASNYDTSSFTKMNIRTFQTLAKSFSWLVDCKI